MPNENNEYRDKIGENIRKALDFNGNKSYMDSWRESAEKRAPQKSTIENKVFRRVQPRKVRTYQNGEEPELLHIIETGFENTYIVVQEDAHEIGLGKSEVFTKEEILRTYGIDLPAYTTHF